MTIQLGKLYALGLMFALAIMVFVGFKAGKGSDFAWVKDLGYSSVRIITQSDNMYGCGLVEGQKAQTVEFYSVDTEANVWHVVACRTKNQKPVVNATKM